MRKKIRGFTLIELLIVIAIILILIAIALPNFLEAQIRARVTKAKSELRTIGIALESYYLDWKIYPNEQEGNFTTTGSNSLGFVRLTSPISYITSIPADPFSAFDSEGQSQTSIIVYESGGVEAETTFPQCRPCLVMWVMWSKGPDQDQSISGSHPNHNQVTFNYSPTNGTKSTGSIYYWGGDSRYVGVGTDRADLPPGGVSKAPIAPIFVDGISYVKKFPPNLP